ncbi:TLC domain protein [Ceratobasidium sp. AG-Ba]|nr:TLC domain protein [Ceratobasidium sp. AG-Ba]
MVTMDELGVTLGKGLGLPHLPEHFGTIAYSFGTFTLVYILSALLSPMIAPQTYPLLSRKTKHSWNVHAVSMAHAMVIGPMALHRLFVLPKVESLEKAFGWEESMGRLHGIAVGFVWDTIESILAQVEIGFVIHGLSCALIFGLSYRPFMAFYGPSALVWELSTPFLNAFKLNYLHWLCCPGNKWYLDKLQMTGGLLQAINGFILLGLFFAVRVCYGIYMSLDFFHTLLEVRNTIPVSLALTYGGGNLALNMLNLFWFTKMIAALRKRFPKPKAPIGSSKHAAPPNKTRTE